MKVILLENIPKIGQKGDVKDLKEGFVRNSLLPSRKVRIATKSDLNNLIIKERKKEEYENAELRRIKKIFDDLKDKIIEINENKNEKGHLFAKINKKEIVQAVYKQHRITINENWFNLEPIKEIGEYSIELCYKKISSVFKIIIK